ncbi:MAG TPA: acetyl-CoA C-acyltransferase [Dinghuibacter sp.]|uniref:acetyl-CoA C-acyltransferase n=1 Tax=Dinghuibacter sp. TaxID=2024697 RepID=UPI002BAD756A|nr:acetyl-CoA C-acyltransferase [Dinghuibacter sp.]HTJ11229.1 acetyl-CoA C-acyltransferase [Dinghuibacter sp.]
MANKEVYILGTARTPIGSFNGALASIPATKLGAAAIKAAIQRAGLQPNDIQEVYMGNVLSAGLGQAPANQASIYAGIPTSVPCTTVNKVCASGMKAVMLGAQDIRQGDVDIVVAGGMESMSNVPYYLDKARTGYRMGNGQLIDGMLKDGLWDPYKDYAMGNAGELCSTKYGLTREMQDAYAIRSYERAAGAYAKEYMQGELVPITTEGRDPQTITEDEEYKKVKFDKIPTLKPAFKPDGVITAANASKINDGAAALVLAASTTALANGWRPLARIVSYADASQDPEWFTTTPTIAMNRALEKAGLTIADIDYFEINEAFSCVAQANARDLGIPEDRLNVWGGAVALGHPIGCSGARITITLLSILQQTGGRYGLAGICNGGGGASALLIERL